ncbi:MAG: DUF308 domain-containing protein [Pseudomonadota bacterium]|nr:DUF308 domain-containing protein [Pseudomonadota bacterium]
MKHGWLWMMAGVLSLLGGGLALANPLAATLTAEWLAGWTFVVSGVMTLVSAFGDKGWGARLLAIALGAALVLMGVFLLGNPLQGIVSLTLAAGFMLAVAGVFRILIAFKLVGGARWALILSGVLSLLLCVMILGNFPQAAAVTLGLFLAVELISNGVSLICLAMAGKAAAKAA